MDTGLIKSMGYMVGRENGNAPTGIGISPCSRLPSSLASSIFECAHRYWD